MVQPEGGVTPAAAKQPVEVTVELVAPSGLMLFTMVTLQFTSNPAPVGKAGGLHWPAVGPAGAATPARGATGVRLSAAAGDPSIGLAAVLTGLVAQAPGATGLRRPTAAPRSESGAVGPVAVVVGDGPGATTGANASLCQVGMVGGLANAAASGAGVGGATGTTACWIGMAAGLEIAAVGADAELAVGALAVAGLDAATVTTMGASEGRDAELSATAT